MIRAPGFERHFDDAVDAVAWNRKSGTAGAVVYRESDGAALTRPLGTKFSTAVYPRKGGRNGH